MRKWWAGVTVLALGLAGTVAVAADDDDAPPQSGWFAHGVYRHTDKPVEKPPEKPKPVDEVKPQMPSREREDNALTRRLAVCDRLREIARKTNNNDLENQVDRLEERINTLYQQRVGRMTSTASTDSAPARKMTVKDTMSKNATGSTGTQEVQP
jgi:hypothetical protein